MRKRLLISLLTVLLLYGLSAYSSPAQAGMSHAAAVQPAAKEYKKANTLFTGAKYKEAIPLYQQVLAAPPDNVPLSDIHTRIADSYFRLGYFKNALESYRNALRAQKRPERPATQYWIGFCCFLLGRDGEAVREFLKIPELYPSSGMWVATAYYWAGRASERMGKKEQAVTYYKKAGGDGRSTQGRFAMKRAESVKSR